jgi:hypothetical protein
VQQTPATVARRHQVAVIVGLIISSVAASHKDDTGHAAQHDCELLLRCVESSCICILHSTQLLALNPVASPDPCAPPHTITTPALAPTHPHHSKT